MHHLIILPCPPLQTCISHSHPPHHPPTTQVPQQTPSAPPPYVSCCQQPTAYPHQPSCKRYWTHLEPHSQLHRFRARPLTLNLLLQGLWALICPVDPSPFMLVLHILCNEQPSHLTPMPKPGPTSPVHQHQLPRPKSLPKPGTNPAPKPPAQAIPSQARPSPSPHSESPHPAQPSPCSTHPQHAALPRAPPTPL
jgi:hypothetical protein